MWTESLTSSFQSIMAALKLNIYVCLYNLHLKILLPKISKHKPIRIMFYVNNLSMWKGDKLLDLLKKDDRFEPFAVSYLYSYHSTKENTECEQELSSHFSSLGVRYFSGFDFIRNKNISISEFKPDIIFFPQPYINYRSAIPLNALLSYIPYGFSIEDSKKFHNSLYQNVCWKYFVTNQLQKELKTKYNINHGVNVVVSGDPLADYFFDGHTPSSDSWPINNPQIKRIIWAPHHSITPQDWLDYSNFLEIADDMLNLAKEYNDKAQFVFKPHPMLKDKLYKLDSWGVEKTDSYFDAWKSLPNCNSAEGNYVDLFMSSDAMIHDCSAFTAEYLYVNKPVMYLTKKERMESFNQFANECFKVHYHGSSISDIKNFIDNVIKGIDPLADERTKLIKEQLRPKGNETVAGTIYKELCKIFE